MMKVSENKQRRAYFVKDSCGDMTSYISTPFPKAKSRSQLTIKTNGIRIDLNGRQIRTLRNILNKASTLSK